MRQLFIWGMISILFTLYGSSADIQSTITVLDKGIKRQIPLPAIDSTQQQSTGSSTSSTEGTNEGVLVAFKHSDLVSIPEFETKYGLKLQSKMVIGYYVFENHSSRSDAQIVADIIANESNVKTVKPNWRLRNTIR